MAPGRGGSFKPASVSAGSRGAPDAEGVGILQLGCGVPSGQCNLFIAVALGFIDEPALFLKSIRNLAKGVDHFDGWVHIFKLYLEHANARTVAIQPGLQ